jgi:acyl carrier protein phosphodiesterase
MDHSPNERGTIKNIRASKDDVNRIMNWLAHLYLSEPNPQFRIGNLLPDLVPASALSGLSPDILRGADQHRRIDAFTDRHPVVRRSISRVTPDFRRFGGILVDVFYDHFLARDWENYSSTPLQEFTAEIYDSFDRCRPEIPPEALVHLKHMRESDWLCAYREIDGILTALERLGLRFRRPVPLGNAISVLRDNYDELHADFSAFFPELMSHLRLALFRGDDSVKPCLGRY